MGALIQSELIKGRRTFGRRCIFIFTLAIALFSSILMGGNLTQIGAYNWWYMILLPVSLALLCTNVIESEKRNHYFNILVLPKPKERIWQAKILTVLLYLLAANTLIFVFTSIGGYIFGAQYPVWRGICAAIVLTWTVAWQIPLGMFLAVRFHSSVTLIAFIGLNVICSGQPIAGGNMWYIPYAIPARLMAPIIGVNPNGIPLEANSPLQSTNVILPGLIITLILFVVVSLITSMWFIRRSE